MSYSGKYHKVMAVLAVLVLFGMGCSTSKDESVEHVHVFESNWTPIQLQYMPVGNNTILTLVAPQSEFPPVICGVNIAPIVAFVSSLYGISIAPFTALYQHNVGVAISLLWSGSSKSALNAGVILAPLQLSCNMLNAGIIGGIFSLYQVNYGVSLGLFNGNLTGKGVNYGLQTGLFNVSHINKGLSIGVVNYAGSRVKGITGYQIGLINICDGLVMPLFMFSGGGEEKPNIDWSSEITEEGDEILRLN